MPREINLNVAPYHDDFDETKNFHQILWQPAIPIQARELNQAQTILQNQIERFGENIYKSGTIIKGTAFSYDSNYSFIKILDNQVDGQPVNISQFANTLVISSTGLSAFVVGNESGLESQNPNLNTLYVKYQNSGSDGKKEFLAGEILTAYDRDFSVQRVNVTTAGTGYNNADIIAFTSNTGTGATGRVVTNSSGAITSVVITAGGTGYLTDPTVAVANSTGGTANGTSAVLAAQTLIAQLSVANSSFESGGNTNYLTVGTGYAFKVSDGIIYQKGYFIRVEPQTIVVQKYNTQPNNVSVGFVTNETIVNENADTSLLDNATGSSNLTAPGAHRLKLTPTLTLVAADAAVDTDKFFTLVEFQDGRIIKSHQTTQFNSISTELARRTSEESGDYIVNPFNIIIDDISSNTTYAQARIGAGTAYVSGWRVEQLDSFSIPIRKGTDLREKSDVDISLSIGNYVYIKSYQGTLPFNSAATVQLQDTLTTGLTAAAGTQIGTAKIRGLVYDTGTPGEPAALYRLYLFDIQMNSGKNFSDVKSVFYDGTDNGTADISLDAFGKAVVYDTNFKTLIYPTGSKAVKTLRTLASNNDTTYIYTTVDEGTSFAANGTLQKNLTGEEFPYSGTLDSISERDFIFIARAGVAVNTASTGNVAINSTSNTVVGTATTFLTDYTVGDYFITGTSEYKRITSIANNTSLSVDSLWVANSASTTHKRYFPAGQPIPFNNKTSRTITITGAQLVASLGEALAGSLAVTSVYNVQRDSTTALTKNINKSSLVKLTTAANTTGPWSLGVPDVHKLISVTSTSNSDYITGAVDITSHFVLDNGQRDSHYGLATLRKKPTSTLAIANDQFIVATVDTFTHTSTGGGIGFFSIDSYPIDDATESLPSSKIRTQEVPLFKSPQSGSVVDLRDSIDFRPVVANTANVTAVLASATVNPSATEAFAAGEKYFPAPSKIFRTSLQHYLGRYDKIALDTTGRFTIVEGTVSTAPVPPTDLNGAMTIATVNIPPYPTLSLKSGTDSKRPDYTASAVLNNKRRYTMADINRIDRRVTQLEYYSALSLLEKQTKDLIIPSAANPTQDAFKNGIFVEPFTDFTLTNLNDGEFTASIDVTKQELAPRFKQSRFELQVANTTNVTVNDDIVSLNAADVAYIVQPYASKRRVCAEDHWNFQGNLSLFPEYFNYYDIRFDPNTGWAGPGMISSFNNSVYLSSGPYNQSNISTSSSTGAINIYADQNFINQIKLLVPAPTTDNSYKAFSGNPNYSSTSEFITSIGDYLRLNTASQPFVYEHSLLVKATGLKPNTHYRARFDGVDVTQWTVGFSKATYDRNIANRYNYLGAGFGNPAHPLLVSTSAGEVYGAFFVPRGYFFTGARLFELLDNISNPTSTASLIYKSYEYDPNANPSIVSTRPIGSSNNTPFTQITQYSTNPLPTTPFTITEPTQYGSSGSLANTVLSTPISQTFYIGTQDTQDQEGMYVPKIDLYFAKKDPVFGVTIEIRTVENDIPTSTVVPQSRVHLTSSQVNVSNTAALATSFTFPSPIFLRAGYMYCLAIKPDGNSPEYEVWVSVAGDADLTRPNIKCRQDWGEGKLYIASNDSSWQPVHDEDLKFTVYRAQFSNLSGSVTLTNRDDEFLSVANTSGTFMHGEPVFAYSNTYILTGNVVVTANSTTLTGTGTTFLTQLVAGAIIQVANTATPVANSGYTSFIVESISNNTTLVLVNTPNFTSANVKAYYAPSAIVSYYYETDADLHLTASTAANNTFKFSNSDVIVGTITGARAAVTTVDNLPIDYFEPLMYRTEVAGTTVTATASLANTSLAIQSAQNFKFNDSNYITAFQAVLGSRSNEITAASGKSFVMNVAMTSINKIVTPTFDVRASAVIRFENIINNDVTNEHTSQGAALSKYISKTIVLKDGQDAEALRVFLTGYKPPGTDLQVYARLLNAHDASPLSDKSWAKLELVGTDRYANPTNLLDFAEYEYTLPETPETTVQVGVVSVANTGTTLTGSNTVFSTALASGDVIKVNDYLNGRYFVTRVSGAPASNTSLTTTSAAPWDATGAYVEKFVVGTAPYLNEQNDNVVEYFGATGSFDTYKTYAIKIVLLAAQSNIVPRATDLRALAHSV